MKPKCFFCGSNHAYLPMIGIALGMAGNDYSFCKDCLEGMTADEFWRKFFKKNELEYPPRLIQ